MACLIDEEKRAKDTTPDPSELFEEGEMKWYCCNGPRKIKWCKQQLKGFSNKHEEKCGVCKKTNHREKDCFFNKYKQNNILTDDRGVNNYSEWIVDSVSTSHIANQLNLLHD